ncbi:hypothetical protein HAX54_044577 [Datura stramonium]|uniref:GRAM domain-containing protein n=1 Tax=Datura stramonium TaxID=4076 RepID=A0ABS8WEW4_DATST|nr:hypothetical protein [Datura stramonium]
MTGLLFISTDKVAFCSERSIKLLSPTGKLLGIRCKVSIPISKIKKAKEIENMEKPSQKYIYFVTEDDFEFWFMGFLNHQKTLRYLQQGISSSSKLRRQLFFLFSFFFPIRPFFNVRCSCKKKLL